MPVLSMSMRISRFSSTHGLIRLVASLGMRRATRAPGCRSASSLTRNSTYHSRRKDNAPPHALPGARPFQSVYQYVVVRPGGFYRHLGDAHIERNIPVGKKHHLSGQARGQPPWTAFARMQDIEEPTGGTATVYANNRYVVIKTTTFSTDPTFPPLVHLSIRRTDRAAIHDWRDLQRIKNELVCPQCEGLEIYPAEERLVDSANQFHLWVFDSESFRLPIGFRERLVAEGTYRSAAVQRPWEPGRRPADCVDSATIERRADSLLWREGNMQE